MFSGYNQDCLIAPKPHKELSFCEKQEFHLIENVSSSLPSIILTPRPSLGRKPSQEASPYGRPRMYSFQRTSRKGSWEATSPGIMEGDRGWRREGSPRGPHLEKWQTLATPGKGEEV